MSKLTWRFMALSVMLVLTGAGRAEDKDCRAVIAKAIQAVGGEEQLMKHQAETFKEKGTFYGDGAAQPYTGKYTVQFPNRFRMEIEGVFTIVLDGNKGWIAMGGNTQEMNKEQLAQQKESQFAGWVTTLLPLVKDKAFQLSPLGESKVGDRAVVGIKVTHPGHNDVKLYFDRENGLLAKCEYRYKDWMSGKDTAMVEIFENYKEFGGLKFPTKMELKRDGKQFVEAEIEDVKAVKKFDANTFAKP